MSLCLVEKRANWSLACTFFLIQQHIILPAAGGKETDRQASKLLALSHFLPPNQKRSVGVIWSPAHSLRSLSHTQKWQQHLSLCPWSPLRAMPPALQANIPAGQQLSEHGRFQQNPIPTGASMLGHEHGCLSETSPVLCTELFTSS